MSHLLERGSHGIVAIVPSTFPCSLGLGSLQPWQSSCLSAHGCIPFTLTIAHPPTGRPAVTVADRPRNYSLWMSSLLPDHGARWELLDSGYDRAALERQARSMAPLLQRRRLVVVDGLQPPRWRPQL